VLGIRLKNFKEIKKERKDMLGINMSDIKDIKIVYERIKEDKRNLKVAVFWKQDLELKKSEDVSVFVEIGDDVKQSYELKRLENSDIWYTTLKIRNTLDEIYTVEEKLAVKLIQYKVRPCAAKCSYAF
jgi:hypothetical protein